MKPEDYNEPEVHRQFDDALKRASIWNSFRTGFGTLRRYAMDGGYSPAPAFPSAQLGQAIVPFDLDGAVPIYLPGGMPRREFAGPTVGDAHLFPMNACSFFVSLGGIGKTTTVIAMAAHIAAGKSFGFHKLTSRKVLGLFVEESQDELTRKYGATVHSWAAQERTLAEQNLRLCSCLDRDARLTRIIGRQVMGSGLAEEIIRAAKNFCAEVVFLDHLQGFVSGDLNISDTATTLAAEANKIVAATGAAVVFTAHISKANIKAEDVLDGFTVGSLAFENAARQVTGVIQLPESEAKKLRVPDPRSDYLMIGMSKNSYGPSRQKAYLRKEYVPEFHTVTVEPYIPAGRPPILTAIEALKERIIEYIEQNPGTTPNKLDAVARKKPPLKATKQAVHEALEELFDEGLVTLTAPSDKERKALRLPYQVKKIYKCVKASPPPNLPATTSPPGKTTHWLCGQDPV